jgi:hypothetical protein
VGSRHAFNARGVASRYFLPFACTPRPGRHRTGDFDGIASIQAQAVQVIAGYRASSSGTRGDALPTFSFPLLDGEGDPLWLACPVHHGLSEPLM